MYYVKTSLHHSSPPATHSLISNIAAESKCFCQVPDPWVADAIENHPGQHFPDMPPDSAGIFRGGWSRWRAIIIIMVHIFDAVALWALLPILLLWGEGVILSCPLPTAPGDPVVSLLISVLPDVHHGARHVQHISRELCIFLHKIGRCSCFPRSRDPVPDFMAFWLCNTSRAVASLRSLGGLIFAFKDVSGAPARYSYVITAEEDHLPCNAMVGQSMPILAYHLAPVMRKVWAEIVKS